MLEILLIIAALATVSVGACLSAGLARGSAPLGMIEAGMKAQWLCGEVHRCGVDGLWPLSPGRWTAVAAALARPAPCRRCA
jgi:hypothetical protein